MPISHKIFINGRFLCGPITGVQRYARELFAALDRLFAAGEFEPSTVNLICLAPPETPQIPEWHHIPVHRVGRFHGNLWEQIELPSFARAGLLFSPGNIGPYLHPRQVVTLHDTSVFAFPQAYTFTFRLKYRIILRHLSRTALRILTDSEFSKTELACWCGTDPDKISVIPLGHEHLLTVRNDERILERLGVRGSPFLLSVASRSPHKNMAALLTAYESLAEPKPVLVLAGGTFGKIFQGVDGQAIPRGVLAAGYVTDSELRALYENALAFVLPSLYEGFGLPVLEAFAFGCPLACSRAASLPEVAGNAALYFDPHRPEDLAEQLSQLISSPELRARLRSAGLERIRGFRWEETARRTWQIVLGN